jgi:hypothetical protein
LGDLARSGRICGKSFCRDNFENPVNPVNPVEKNVDRIDKIFQDSCRLRMLDNATMPSFINNTAQAATVRHRASAVAVGSDPPSPLAPG